MSAACASNVHQCAECSTALDDLAAVSADLCRLPAPIAPAGPAGPHRGARGRGTGGAKPASATAQSWPVGAGLFAWMAALATWGSYRLLAGSAGWLEWLVLTTVPAYMAAGAVRLCSLPPPS